MSQDVPVAVKMQLGSRFVQTNAFEVRLGNLGDPDFIALATGLSKTDRRDLAPRAHATMEHVAHIVQVASYHIYLAHYERIRHRDHTVASNPDGGNVAAAFLFDSFALHAIAVERHLTVALSFQFGIEGHQKKIPNGRIKEVHRFLKDNGHASYADLLQPFQHDHHWQWLREYRDRWEHCDPVRVAELGMQFSNMRTYWKEEPTIGPGGIPAIARTLSIGGGDKEEITVEGVLEKGVYCFNLMAKQVDSYISLLEAVHQNPLVINL